jgi:ATP-dependent phosphoenolpyruvate carboxykinase
MRPAESFAFVCRDGADSISIALLRSTTEFALTASLNVSLDSQGFATGATIHANLGTAALVEHALRKGEGRLTKDGALLVDTGRFTGRSVKDKYVRVITELAWHGLFIRHLAAPPVGAELDSFAPEFTIINCPASRPIRPATAAAPKR